MEEEVVAKLIQVPVVAFSQRFSSPHGTYEAIPNLNLPMSRLPSIISLRSIFVISSPAGGGGKEKEVEVEEGVAELTFLLVDEAAPIGNYKIASI